MNLGNLIHVADFIVNLQSYKQHVACSYSSKNLGVETQEKPSLPQEAIKQLLHGVYNVIQGKNQRWVVTNDLVSAIKMIKYTMVMVMVMLDGRMCLKASRMQLIIGDSANCQCSYQL